MNENGEFKMPAIITNSDEFDEIYNPIMIIKDNGDPQAKISHMRFRLKNFQLDKENGRYKDSKEY